jgi:hypothetical protein
MNNELIAKLKMISNTDHHESGEDLQYALEEINDLLNSFYPEVEEAELEMTCLIRKNNMSNFKEFKNRSTNGGIQYLAFFPNGYGVSIVQHSFSYGNEKGLWEMAVIKGDDEDWDIIYDTPITNDVLGHLSENEVDEYVEQVMAL